MKSVVLALGAVVLLGCAGQPSSRSVVESPQDTVFDELAAVVDQALAAKSIEENRLVQYGVEKQRLVSRLMPNGDWGDGHPLAIEGYVSERDPEAAKNLSVVLDPEFMGAEAGPVRYASVPRTAVGTRRASSSNKIPAAKTGPPAEKQKKTERAERQGRKSQNRAKNPKQNIPNSSDHPSQRGGDGKKV